MMIIFSILVLLLAFTAQGTRLGHIDASFQSKLGFKNELWRKGMVDSEYIHSSIKNEIVDKKRKWRTDRPLIGILSQGGEPAPEGSSYIAASYVKFVESAGARAVPILHDMSKKEMERRFRAVNGILIPGGGQDLSPGHPYYDAVEHLFDLAVKENDAGVVYPNHMNGIAFDAFAENPMLDEFFQVLTLSIDREKNVYVSTMEAKEYPFSATQWHPEKNAFEWTLDEHIPHHPEAIEVTQEVANMFVDLARMNNHAPESRDDEEDLLIYNWSQNIRYSGKRTREGEEVNFDQIYVFPDHSVSDETLNITF
eukprot:jgi/Picsp_1/1921/NSC_05387-R1_protein